MTHQSIPQRITAMMNTVKETVARRPRASTWQQHDESRYIDPHTWAQRTKKHKKEQN